MGKITPSKGEVVRGNGLAKDIAAEIVIEAGKAYLPLAFEAMKNKIKLDQETQQLLRDDKRKILN